MTDCGVRSRGRSPKAFAAWNESKSSGSIIVKTDMCDPGTPVLLARVLHGGRFNFFRSYGGKAVSPIIGNRSIDDRSAVDTFPSIEG